MPQVSKRVLDKNIEKKIKENFLEALASLRDKKLAYRFIYDFLTPTERIMLAKRLAMALMIYKGYPHRQISEALKVSTATISSIVIWMKYEGEGYREILNKLSRKETIRALWHKIDYYLKGPMPGAKGSKEDYKKMYKKQYESQPIETPLGLVKEK